MASSVDPVRLCMTWVCTVLPRPICPDIYDQYGILTVSINIKQDVILDRIMPQLTKDLCGIL